VRFANCEIHDSRVAAALYMKDGGIYENVVFQNLTVESKGDFPFVIDITPRDPSVKRPGQIRDVRFENLEVKGPGRFYIEGTREDPVHGVVIENMSWEVTGECNLTAEKPAGAARVQLDPQRVNPATVPFHMVVVNADGVTFDSLKLSSANGVHGRDRGFAFFQNAPGAEVTNCSSDLTPEGLEEIRHVLPD
jgi:hypothetical protein